MMMVSFILICNCVEVSDTLAHEIVCQQNEFVALIVEYQRHW